MKVKTMESSMPHENEGEMNLLIARLAELKRHLWEEAELDQRDKLRHRAKRKLRYASVVDQAIDVIMDVRTIEIVVDPNLPPEDDTSAPSVTAPASPPIGNAISPGRVGDGKGHDVG